MWLELLLEPAVKNGDPGRMLLDNNRTGDYVR